MLIISSRVGAIARCSMSAGWAILRRRSAPGDAVLYPLLLVVALSLFALIPLLQTHLFASSDGLYHVYRAIEIGACLQDGAWVCRWAPDQFLGYGTPLFDFYSPFVYYISNV